MRQRSAAPRLVLMFVVMALVAAACTSGEADSTTTTTEPTTTAAPPPTLAPAGNLEQEAEPDPGFYVNLIWHQHQPRYPLLEDGTISRPWVRVHATKDYFDMAALHDQFPEVKATFNLTPVLQIGRAHV